MTKTTIKTPTASAIDTAIRNADKMAAQGYTLKQSGIVPEAWFVIKPRSRFSYMVNTVRETCECEQFQFEGVCKHQKFVDDEIRIREMEEEEDAQRLYRKVMAERDAAEAWPTCPLCGTPLDDAANGQPVSFCGRCEKWSLK